MKLIPLYGKDGIGKFAQVYDEDYDKLSIYRWFYFYSPNSSNWYVRRNLRINGKLTTTTLHRDVLKVAPKVSIDHIDGDTSNNQKSNLRTCTASQNSCNKKSRTNSTSKYLGVCYEKERVKWVATIKENSKTKKIGRFPYTSEGEIQAAKAYDEAAKKYHGEFARLNFKE